jgi:hypothetical protein
MTAARQPQTLRQRLEVYRALLRRQPPLPELQRLVLLLEDELRAGATGRGRRARK